METLLAAGVLTYAVYSIVQSQKIADGAGATKTKAKPHQQSTVGTKDLHGVVSRRAGRDMVYGLPCVWETTATGTTRIRHGPGLAPVNDTPVVTTASA